MNDDFIGKQVANFRIDRLLGKGGMASVYYGWDVQLDRPVALKMIDARYQGREEYARRFIAEAKSIATWRHPNVVQVYYANNQDQFYYFVMEYIDGINLSEHLMQYAINGEMMPYPEVIEIGTAIAVALDYAHSKGIVHRDVKPSNIMLSTDRRIILTDFGLALDIQTGSIGEVFGTPHYIAPEQARRSSDAVPQSDLYALGVILYEMLTGAVPFDDPSPTSLAVQHLTMPPPPPRSINPNLSQQVEDVLLKALSKAPEDRYPTGDTLISALKKALMVGASASNVPSIYLPPPPAGFDITPPQPSTRPNMPKPKQPSTKPAPKTIATPQKSNNRVVFGAMIIIILALIMGMVVILSNQGASNDQVAILPTTVILPTATNTDIPVAIVPTNTTIPVVIAITNTDIPVAIVPTNTDIPVAIVPTSTTIPVAIAPTNTDIPVVIVVTNTDIPVVVAPTSNPVAVNTPQPTVLYPNGQILRFFYSPTNFVIWNGTSANISPGSVRFEAIDANSAPTGYSFDGARWLAYYGIIQSNWCSAVAIISQAIPPNPAICRGENSRVTPMEGSLELFWLAQGGAVQFRVFWDDQEVGRCAILTGETGGCEVFIP